jgi:beta-glucosidase
VDSGERGYGEGRAWLALALLLAAAAACNSQNTQREPLARYRNPDLPAVERAADVVRRMTVSEKIAQTMTTAPAIPRLGVPAYDWWSEALHGVARAGRATVFPQAIALAATFDEKLVQRVAAVISDEARAKYNQAQARGSTVAFRGSRSSRPTSTSSATRAGDAGTRPSARTRC